MAQRIKFSQYEVAAIDDALRAAARAGIGAAPTSYLASIARKVASCETLSGKAFEAKSAERVA